MQNTLKYAVLFLFLSLVAVCWCVPVYTDELVWHSILARIFDDGLLAYTKVPECTSVRAVEIPWLLVPGRVLASLIYYKISPPYLLRSIAVVVSLLSAYIACEVIKRVHSASLDPDVRASFLARMLFVMAITAGISPAWRATARPEGLFSLVFMASILIAVVFHTRRASILTVGMFTVASLCIFSLHPKGLFFLPLIIFAGTMLRVERWGLISKSMCAVTVGIGAVQSVAFYRRYYECPNAPKIAQFIGTHMLNPKMAIEDPFEYVGAVLSNVMDVFRYVNAIVAPQGSVYGGWLPSHDLGLFDSIWLTSGVAICVVLSFVTLCGAVGCVNEVVKARSITMQTGLPLLLLGCELGLVAHQSNANQYEGPFLIGMLGFNAAISLQFCRWLPFNLISRLLPLSVVCITVSVVSFVAAYYPLTTRMYVEGVKGNFPHRFNTGIQLYNYSQTDLILSKLLKECDIDLAKVNGILVDDSSYPFAQRALRPIHTMGTTWWTEPGSNQYQVLQEAGIEAVIASCRSLKPETVARSRQLAGYCCAVIDR